MKKLLRNKRMCKLIPKEENDNQTIIDKKIIEKVCPVCGYIFKKEIKKIIKNEPIITTYHGFFIYDLNKIEIENIIEEYNGFNKKDLEIKITNLNNVYAKEYALIELNTYI